jgi:hypothetical protein
MSEIYEVNLIIVAFDSEQVDDSHRALTSWMDRRQQSSVRRLHSKGRTLLIQRCGYTNHSNRLSEKIAGRYPFRSLLAINKLEESKYILRAVSPIASFLFALCMSRTGSSTQIEASCITGRVSGTSAELPQALLPSPFPMGKPDAGRFSRYQGERAYYLKRRFLVYTNLDSKSLGRVPLAA